MVVDVKLSEDCMAAFQEHLTTSSTHLPFTFSTLVLQVSLAWPANMTPSSWSTSESFHSLQLGLSQN